MDNQEALLDVWKKLEKWHKMRERVETLLDSAAATDDLPSFEEIAGVGYDVVEALGRISISIEDDLIRMLESLARRRREKHQIQDHQKRLLRDVCGDSNEVAIKAIHTLRHMGWLTGEDRWLTGEEGVLKGADLTLAKLRNANLNKANLEGAILRFADLTNATLEDAKFDEQTQLPDGKFWSPDVDLSRFTNADHPLYWNANSDDDDTAQVFSQV